MTAAWPVDSGLAPVIPITEGLEAGDFAAGVAASSLIGPEGPILVVLGGILTEVLGGGQSNAQRVQNAINNAVAANIAGNTQRQLNMGAQVYGTWKTAAILAENGAATAVQAAQAAERLRFYIGLLQGEVGSAVSVDLLNQYFAAIQNEVVGLGQEVVNAYNAANANATAQFEQAEGDARLEISQAEYGLEQSIQGALNQAVLEARTDSNTVVAWVEKVVGDIFNALQVENNEINLALQQLDAFIMQELQTLAGYAQSAAGDAIQSERDAQSTALQTTLEPLWAGTAASANQATDELVVQHPDELNNLYHMTEGLPQDAISAISGLAIGLKTATQALNDCVLPNCDTVTKIANPLKAIESLLVDGTLLAFIVAAATDPKPIAKVFTDVVNPVTHPMLDAIKGLL